MAEETKVAVVNLESGLVENIAVVSDGDGSAAPDGFQFVASDDAATGDSWDGATIIKAPQPVVEVGVAVGGTIDAAAGVASVEADQTSTRLDALEARMAAVEAKVGL